MNAKKPNQTFDETMKADVAEKSKVMDTHKKLLEKRYTLIPKLDPAVKMTRGKAIAVGPTARLASGVTWDQLGTIVHELEVERFTNEPPDGAIKTFTLRGIKESPRYLHDGRLLTLEDTVEFFNLVLGTKLSAQEKTDLVAFLRTL